MSAFDDFLADVTAKRCWLAEIDAFILAPAADNASPSSAYAVPSYAEAAYGEGEPVQLIETLNFSSHGFISKKNRSVGYLQLAGSPDHGKPATLGFDFTGGSIDPVFGDAAITVTRAGATATRWALVERYLSLPGTAGNYASTPDSAAVSITGDFDFRFKGAANDYTPAAENMLASVDDGNTQRAWELQLMPSGVLEFIWWESDGTLRFGDSTAATAVADGTTKWLRVTLDVDDGAGGHAVKFWMSDDGETWTQLGATVNAGAFTTSMRDTTASLIVGGRGDNIREFAGKVYYAEVRNGIDGPVVAKFDPSTSLPSDTQVVSSTGETWTLNGTARIVGAHIVACAANEPRFDHDPVTLACKGLLIEAARINKFLDSEEAFNWTSVSNVTVTDSGIPSPIAGKNWQKLTVSASPALVVQRQVGGGAAAGNTFSIYVKKGSGASDANKFNFYNITTAQDLFFGSLNYDTGVFTVSGGTGTARVVALGDNAYRLELTNTAGVSDGDTIQVYTGFPGSPETVGEYLYAIGGQVEDGTFATSYIPTTSAAVTRNADVPVVSDISGFYSASEGTIIAEAFAAPANPTAQCLFSFNNGIGSTQISAYRQGGAMEYAVQIGGVSQAVITGGAVANDALHRQAAAYKENDFASAVNGAQIGTDVSGSLPTVDRLHLGHRVNEVNLNGHLRRFYYFPTRLADATLQSISDGEGPVFELGEVEGGDADSRAWYDGRLRPTINVERRIFGEQEIGGLAVTLGEIALLNHDGGLDALLEQYAFDGRAFRLLVGPELGAREDFGLVFSGVIERSTQTLAELRLALSDGIARLSVPVNSAVYPTGGLGGGADIIGKPRPRCWGAVFNVSPPLVEAAALIYQVNDGAISDVPDVYDRGVELVQGADYASQEDMENNAPAAGNYRVWKGGGFFRLGSTPAGTVTANVLGDAGGAGYVDMTGEIVERVLGQAGIESAIVDAASIAALNAAAPAAVGVWIGTESRTCGEVIEQLLMGVGAFGGFSRVGLFTVGVVAEPAGAPAARFTEEHILGLSREPLPSAVEPVVWRARVAWQRNYTVQNDLAAAVTAARRAFAAEAERIAKADDTGLQSRRRLAREYGPSGNLYAEEADAATEAIRLLALWGTPRGLYRALLPPLALARDLGDVVELAFPRHGFEAGRSCRVLGHAVRGARVELVVVA